MAADKYEIVIGLEIHAQLKTASKIFCNCSTKFGSPPNTQVCPVCMGMPGVLPVLNREVVNMALKIARAISCEISIHSEFARKNYFYPDLPKGYQITQYRLPLAEHGQLIVTGKEREYVIGITRIHIEEDAGKNFHGEGGGYSLIDFNRCGIPLVEIVTEPDIRSTAQAAETMRALRDLLVWLDVCDGNMEEGSLRCDANISIRPFGILSFGTRTEIKNLNSFRNLQRALEFEAIRHKQIIEAGGLIIQETRLFDPASNATFSMRSKEEAHDYRYFPEPDLPPLILDKGWVEEIDAFMLELPSARRHRFVDSYGLSSYDASILTSSIFIADYFEKVVGAGVSAKSSANWVMGDVTALLKERNLDFSACPLHPENLAEMISLIENKTISGKIAKELLPEMFLSNKSVRDLVNEKGLSVISDTASIQRMVEEIISANSKQVEQYRAGKTGVLGFFVGQIMKKTGGKAEPKIVSDLVKTKLEKS